jgi:hypothetical protein
MVHRVTKYRQQKREESAKDKKEAEEQRILASERYHRIQELETENEYLREENARLKRRL